MSTFDVSAYNNLPSIANANARFDDQLASAGLTRNEFFKKLGPIFLEAPYVGRYAACLLHRHYTLNAGERMVTTGPSARPSTDTSSNVVDERWASNGEVIEFKFIDNPTSHPLPPPAEFFAKFKSIVDAHGIDILGVCYAPEKLADGYMFLESPGTEDREQVTALVHSSVPQATHSIEAVWVPNIVEGDGPYMLRCANCTSGCECIPYKVSRAVAKFGITL